LILSPGLLTFQGRTETQDGIDIKLQLHYYARFLIVQELLPLLKAAAAAGEEARVLTVLHAGQGGPLHKDDLDLKHSYGLKAAADSATLYSDLMVQEWSERNPEVTFVHAFPGIVRTDLARESSLPLRLLFGTMAALVGTSAEVCGDYMTYAVTAPEYRKGWYLLGSSAQTVRPTRYQTEEAREIVYKHSVQMVGWKE